MSVPILVPLAFLLGSTDALTPPQRQKSECGSVCPCPLKPPLTPHQAQCAQRPAKALAYPRRKLEIEKSFHLPRKPLAVPIPPDFLDPRHAVRVHIFQPHHFFQPKAPMRSAHTTGFQPAVRSLADTEAGDHIVHHDRASLNAPRQTLAAHPVSRPHARCQTIF